MILTLSRLIPLLLMMQMCAAAQMRGPTLNVCQNQCAYSNIQEAIDAATDGDTIRIHQGVYTGPIFIADKQLTMKGDGAALSTIDRRVVPESPAPPTLTLHCTNNQKIAVAGVTVTGGLPVGEFGGGGIVNAGCNATVDIVVVSNNASRGGGGIVNDGNMLLRNAM